MYTDGHSRTAGFGPVDEEDLVLGKYALTAAKYGYSRSLLLHLIA